jgi:nucleotide-binding universal stress UspA family protein
VVEDRLITVAIHTYDKAVILRTLLEHEGIEVVLNNVNLQQPVVSSGVRVRIHESDLPLALRIIENGDIFNIDKQEPIETSHPIIVPIDFSEYSFKATIVAFKIAQKFKAEIKLLHSYIDPYVAANMQLSDNLTYEIADSAARQQLEVDAQEAMDEYSGTLKLMMKKGELPIVKFSTKIVEGVPEDAIIDYAKSIHPLLVIMGTRGASQKEKDMIGSVTAEVLDECRFTVLSVPDCANADVVTDINNVMFFSNLDQSDILAIDSLCRLFPDSNATVTIIVIPPKKRLLRTQSRANADTLLKYCNDHFDQFKFDLKTLNSERILEDFNKLEASKSIDLFIIPNKRKNIFTRLFNPTLAHKILLHADIPMLVIPV